MQEGAGQKLAAAAGQRPSTVSRKSTAPAPGARTGSSVSISGLDFPRYFSTAGIDPFDEVEWELRDAVIGNERGKVVFEQRDVEIPKSWSQLATNVVVSKYFRGHLGTPERERSVKQLIGRVVDTITAWAAPPGLLRDRRRAAGVPRRAQAPAPAPEGGLQPPGLVQLRRRDGAAVLGLLHQLGRRHDGVDPRPGQDRGHALQVRLRHRHQPVGHPLLEGAARRRRHGLGPGLVHEGLRRLRRRDQVGRQDPPRREDGDPQRRPSRHRRVHQLQGRGGEEGLGADRRRLRRLVQRRGRTPRSSSRTPTTRCASTDEFMHAVLDDGDWQTHAVTDRRRRSTPTRRAT